jgi:hypothetical protein
MAPIDLAISDDPTIEAVARDAIFEGQFDRAMALRGTTQTMEDIVAYALPGTKNVLLVSKQHVRVI